MKNNKGITLIALVITIIVMLILVGVTISMAVNGGLFNYAGNAVGDTRNALNDEQLLTNTDIIDYYVNRKPAVTSLKAYSIDLLNDEGVLEENTKYESGYNIAVIPKGFKVSDVASEQTIAGGLVIEDAEGNQFVWIPVKDGEFKRTEWWKNTPIEDKTLEEVLGNPSDGEIRDGIAKELGFNSAEELMAYAGCSSDEDLLALFEAQFEVEVDSIIDVYEYLLDWPGELSEEYTENLSTDPTGEYENMVASVNKYGGFYIGRYEAGSNENRYETRTDETVLVKKGAYPYNYVAWGTSITEYKEVCAGTHPAAGGEYNFGHGAVYLSKNMYTGDEYGVTSTLCYGVQWDATLRFVRNERNVTDSSLWGNFLNTEFIFTGEYSSDNGKTWNHDETTKKENETWLLTTGASEENKAKNIYDLTGNVEEWTMEIHKSEEQPVLRGGYFEGYGIDSKIDFKASTRNGLLFPMYFGRYHWGFRPTLYIK